MSKSKINFDDFQLDNVIDPDYKPKGLVSPPEPVEPEPDVEPTPEPAKPTKVKDKVVPAQEPPTDPGNDEEGEEVEPDGAGQLEAPDEVPDLDLKPFYQLFHEKLGWDLKEDEMPENSVDGLLSYMNQLIEENSKPQYSSEIVEQFDQFIAAGGDPQRFVSTMFGTKDYTNVDKDSDNEKKQVLKEYLNKTNPEKDSTWIERKISRYEESGVFDDEFNDALDELISMQAKEKAQLVDRQRQEEAKRVQEYQDQIKELERTILSKKEIAGIPVNEKQTKEFADFLTKPGKDGRTAYEKAIAENKEAAITMAFLAYNKFDVNNLKKNVKSDVVKDLKKSLSKFSSSTSGLSNKTSVPVQSNNPDYKAFDLGI